MSHSGKAIITFFHRYQRLCEDFYGDRIHIPRPDSRNGAPRKNIKIMFINERPGRIGPGATDAISFDNPDPTARRFKRLFNKLGISRKTIFISNACIYYPLKKQYRDRPPTPAEITFSIEILKDQIKRVEPKILVPLGNTALGMLKRIYPNSPQLVHYQLNHSVGLRISDTRPQIFPLYHTSNRATITRKEKQQEKDWVRLKRIITNL